MTARRDDRTWSKEGFVISCDPARLDVARIHDFLSHSYWAQGMPRALLERAITNSLCFGLYAGDEQVGFARVVTDRATFAYLTDVFVLESERGRGLGTWLLESVRAHPDLQGLRRFVLVTRDAHRLYARLGFSTLAAPGDYLEMTDADVYRRAREPATSPDRASNAEILTLTPLRDDASPDLVPSERQSGIAPRIRVRALEAGDGRLLKQLRLAALRESPQMFGERLDDALARSDDQWEEQARALAEPDGPRLFVAHVDGEPAGLVLAVDDPNDRGVLRVGGMWVAPVARRRGASRLLLDATLTWARTRGKPWLRLWVHEDAPAAQACYEAFGFVRDGARKPFPRDPSRALISMEFRVEAVPEPAHAHP